ncbi:A/G-specific adenine glycosylase [Desulfuromonas versatilis]|uniref:Adenine DNA glycosylase n=1 Tax=Desulfuromonas versatilis TaxID=2802975 RepID=A0ABN6DSC6_9BACT|nr:A/G-specific adenine glycosylase [Desulfuromonas versatilis]BCR03104.1 A/G-specific adenine glycosylase [Desulfuromonas versatilis]
MSSPVYPKPAEVSRRLLAWYGRHGRDLPWRGTRDPYRIWLSEVMLQQTGVTTVIPYYERFLGRFPTVSDLAAAPLEELIELWAGLGYYSRARNLHAAARRVVEVFDGSFPAELEALISLPGVGRSTAGAIRSIAFDLKGPILDGNVRRVLCRLYALEQDPRASAAERFLWARAEELTPAERPHDYAQAIMDLGATVCTPRSPDCPACPLEGLCLARARGLEKALPLRGRKKAVPTRTQVALLLERQGRWLVRRRPYAGMLGGLWEFPAAEVPEGDEPGRIAEALLDELGFSASLRHAGRVAHAYSHFKLDLHLFAAKVSRQGRAAENQDSCWADLPDLAAMPLHGAHKKALACLPGSAGTGKMDF